MTALRDELQAMVACTNGRVADYRIIEVLADHVECRLHPNGTMMG